MKRKFIWLIGAMAALPTIASGPTDNLRADYRNPVVSVTNKSPRVSSVDENYVQLGLGSGIHWTTNKLISGYKATTASGLQSMMKDVWKTPNIRSTLGVPISAQTANKFLGEPLDPPANWDGNEPEIAAGTGGQAVWVDFAKKVITTQAGPIEVRWRLTDGTEETEMSVVAASPSKRPVRLYWTHQRPVSSGSGYLFKPLQNAGPTVQFGSNYKVHIYQTSNIKLLQGSGYNLTYTGDDGTEQYYGDDDGIGYIRLDGQKLQALEGARGRSSSYIRALTKL